jgi:hypothetical protein
VFVKEEHRRQGLGSALVQHIQSLYPEKRLMGGRGIEGSYQFFKVNGVNKENPLQPAFDIHPSRFTGTGSSITTVTPWTLSSIWDSNSSYRGTTPSIYTGAHALGENNE